MYCINDTLYLEEAANGAWNISQLTKNDEFCRISYTLLRYVSLPLGLTIIFINFLAYKAISQVIRSHQAFGGNAVTLKAITFFDIFNGVFLVGYFVQIAMGEMLPGSIYIWKVEVWLSWLCIYCTVLYRLYLCCQRLYSYGMLLYTAENTHLIPESRGKSYRVCAVLFIVANLELTAVTVTHHYQKVLQEHGFYTIPFLLLQDFAVVVVCVLSIWVLAFSRLREYRGVLLSSAVVPLCLISLSSVLSNFVTFYGDTLCLSKSIKVTNPFLISLKPECFIPLAKSLTYIDSLCFPIILFFSSANIRRSLKVVIFGTQPYGALGNP